MFFCFAIFFGLQGCNLSQGNKSQGSQKSVTSENSAQGVGLSVLSPREKQGFFVWLFQEMHEQIFLTHEQNQKDLSAWINVFNQGGSIEGVYHGLVLSTQYAELERGSVSLPAIRLMGEEVAWLKIPDEKAEAEQKKIAQKIVQENMGLSLFTVKRIFGDYLLREIDGRKADRPSLAKWYAELAVRWAKKDVNFGMAQRNKPDFEFHRDWAMTNSVGMIQWELLNRAHRLFNHFGGIAESKKSAPTAAK